jgi:hypothetical protein
LSTPPAPRKHRIITRFQEEALQAVFSIPEAESFALAGGTALSEYYLGHRLSEDVDLFSFEAEAVPLLGERLISDLPTILPGASISRFRRYPTFQGFLVTGPDSSLKVDIGVAAGPRLGDFGRVDGVNVLGSLDLFVDNLHAFYSRRLPRDAVDVWAMVTILKQDIADLEPLLFAKDQGMLVDRLGWVDAFLAPTQSEQLIPSDLRSMMLVPLDDATLRSFLVREAESVAGRIAIPSRSGFVYHQPEGAESGPDGSAELPTPSPKLAAQTRTAASKKVEATESPEAGPPTAALHFK